jgi:hypothetical protein
VGVVGQTEREATEKFYAEFARWVSIVDDTVRKTLDVPK